MARKKPAKKAKKKSPAKAAARKMVKKTARKSAKKAARKATKKAPKKGPTKRAAKPARRAARVARAARAAKPAPRAAKARPAVKTVKPKARLVSAATPAARPAISKKKPNLDRPRKTVADVHGIPSSLDMVRSASSAKSGRAEMRDKLSKTTGDGPALTGGDIDADWQSAEAVGDEAPGGDNPTPDQDVVDEIGRSLGVEYEDDEELQGGAEISERDHHRWELDPSSKEDFEDEE